MCMLTLPNKEGFLEVKNRMVWVEVVGTFYRLQHEKNLVPPDEHFKGKKMRLDLLSGKSLERSEEVTSHLQGVRRLLGMIRNAEEGVGHF